MIQLRRHSGKGETVIVPAHWQEMRIADMRRSDWSWSKVTERISAKRL